MAAIPFRKLHDEWMKDAEYRKEYELAGPRMELAMTLAAARRKAGLTQAELAARMKTSQAAVARMESGREEPNWGTITRYARAIGAHPVLTLEAAE